MEFFLKVKNPQFPFTISYNDAIWMMGSCFTENIGKYFLQHGFNVRINDMGIIYNPVSIAENINLIINKKELNDEDLLQRGQQYFSWLFHSQIYANSKAEFKRKINDLPESDADIWFITFGTAWVYRRIANDKIVANCHQQPAANFKKELLSSDEIIQKWVELLTDIIAKNEAKKVIFTVSPVRHWKDGAFENSISKGVLFKAVHDLMQIFPKNVFYFPAYEWIIDELRDYRFFQQDKIHPNESAVQFIWEKCVEILLDKQAKEILQKVNMLNKSLLHKPLRNDDNFIQFRKKLEAEIDLFVQKHPFLEEHFKKLT